MANSSMLQHTNTSPLTHFLLKRNVDNVRFCQTRIKDHGGSAGLSLQMIRQKSVAPSLKIRAQHASGDDCSWNNEMEVLNLVNLSSLDVGRKEDLGDLRPIFSENSLFRYRIIVQVKWLLKLSDYPEIKEVPAFNQDARNFLDNIIQKFSKREIPGGKETEQVSNLDARDTISFLKEICKNHEDISKVLKSSKLLCTRAEVYIAYGMMVRDAIDSVIFPLMTDLWDTLYTMAKANADVWIHSHTPGQDHEGPKTLKEILIPDYAYPLRQHANYVKDAPIFVQFSDGYPQIIAQDFVTSLSLKLNADSTGPQYCFHELFSCMTTFNTKLANAYQKVGDYTSDGYFKLEGESIKFDRNKSKLLNQNMLEALANRLPYKTRCTNDIVGQFGYSLLEYTDILEVLKKLK